MNDSTADEPVPRPTSSKGPSLPEPPASSPNPAQKTGSMRSPENDSARPNVKLMAEVRHLVSKMRDDSTWNQLTPEQIERLEGWLFDENLGYAKAVERVKAEFGVEGTISSMGRYYRRRARERQVEEFADAKDAAFEVNDLPVSVPRLREAVLKLLYKAVLKLAIEKPGEVAQFCSFTKLLLAGEDNAIRRARLKLAQQCFDYEAIAASQKELPHLRALLKVAGADESQTDKEKMERIHEILYGWDGSKLNRDLEDNSNNGA